jgi:DNA-binding LacI/PurR family transcriptional regulator
MAIRSERSKPASIKDVAALANVSVPTVSRYLNSRERVSEEKRNRIANSIRLLHYRPNPIARALVSERTKLVTLLSTNTTLYGQSQTIRGVEQRAREAGYALNIGVLSGDDRSNLQQSVQSCLDQNPAGVILLNYDQVGNDAYSFLRHDIPLVLVAGDRQEDTCQISMQERQGGYELTQYLLHLGHKTVYHVAIPGGGGGYSRLAGWRSACEDAGVPAPAPIEANWDPECGRQIGRKLGESSDVTAVFAGNDEIGMGVIRGLNDVGRRVPEDVMVAGFDDHPIAKIWNPSLTTIRQDFYQAGMAAFSMVESEIQDVVSGLGRTEGWSRLVEISGKLIVRESTARTR